MEYNNKCILSRFLKLTYPTFNGECGRETPFGGNFGILAFADHLHALKLYNTLQERENIKYHNRATLTIMPPAYRLCFQHYL